MPPPKTSDIRKPDCSDGGFDDILCDIDRYCGIIDQVTKDVCLETGILELWGFEDPAVYEALTVDKILDAVNKDTIYRCVEPIENF